jgi:selT/selW/selH-like putative selenoprotein
LAEAIKKEKDVQIEFIQSSGGVFEVYRDAKKIFSKKVSGRFPQPEERIKLL